MAQVDRSGLNGTVTDATGRGLPGTRVTARLRENGLVRETVSSAEGTFSLPGLPIGSYTVTFEHAGFSATSYEGLVQTVDHTGTLNATLRVSGATEHVEVPADSQLLDRTTSTLTGLIERKQADELPLNGRDWSSLTAYIPGRSTRVAATNGRSGLPGAVWTIATSPTDGVDATNVINQTQRAWARLAIPLDAIAEFRVDTLMATAEDGATGGAQLAVASPTGTNQFHGRLFEFLAITSSTRRSGVVGVAQQKLRVESVRRIAGRTNRA